MFSQKHFKLFGWLGPVIVSVFLAPNFGAAQNVFTHVHLRVPDTVEAGNWYHAVFGGELREIGPGAAIRYHNGFVGTMDNEGGALPSTGGVFNHIGIGVADVRAAVETARKMGATIEEEPRQGITAQTIAFIVDPWGIRFELLEDPQYPGINHVHMMTTEPDEMRDWFLDVFGGQDIPERGRGNFHTILYGNVWVHISRSEEPTAPSRYRTADHIGFRVASLDEFTVLLEASGYEAYLRRPNPPGSDLIFLEGAGGIHVEVSEAR